MSEENNEEKTEEPTQHRREKAREEGQIPRSKELGSFSMLLVGLLLLTFGGEHLFYTLIRVLQYGLSFNRLQISDPILMFHQLKRLLNLIIGALAPILFCYYITGVLTPLLVGGIHFGGKSLKLDIKRLNPLSGLKRLFSAQVISELVKSCMKVILLGSGCTLYLIKNKSHFIHLGGLNFEDSLSYTTIMIYHCSLMVILFLLPVVGYDIFHQLFSSLKKLRMTRQEIRDEFKQQEGHPQIKNRIKQMQYKVAQSRMMQSIPEADVIINNPTHFSVALAYKENNMSAPTVLAKGAGEIAMKIRQLGQEHKVPMLEAPPLARALYRHGEVGKQIPTELYSAVAEVLGWVYSLRRWQKSGGSRPVPPQNLYVSTKLDFEQEQITDG
ncbi:TPA: flagellar biosynthesis protein FlhB [Salmonella enterica]|uniref:Flagellar biosynthetic protein FlhB n=1 Tax=Salmonella enterica TaxID=28901 RepID=A0A757C509_SALER|nr:flagellar biosynthesis protein FlhB [Salmonella enterica subsp. enterica serovar Richmond]HAG0390732.1 flagellar biosynthesis protein FlhB [Salmonella enterica]